VQRRIRQRGQGLIEMALVVPLIILLFLGVYTAADLSNNKDTVEHAVRQGARLAAEIGNDGYKPGTKPWTCQAQDNDPCHADAEIIKAVMPILSAQLPHAVVQEIDVYQPAPCPNGTSWGSGCPPDNGAYQSGDLLNQYNADGTLKTGSPQSYTLDKRTQQHPNEASIAVRVTFQYTSPTLKMFSTTLSQYADIRLAPTFT